MLLFFTATVKGNLPIIKSCLCYKSNTCSMCYHYPYFQIRKVIYHKLKWPAQGKKTFKIELRFFCLQIPFPFPLKNNLFFSHRPSSFLSVKHFSTCLCGWDCFSDVYLHILFEVHQAFGMLYSHWHFWFQPEVYLLNWCLFVSLGDVCWVSQQSWHW